MIFANLNKREKFLLYLTVALLVIWVLHGFIVKPIANKWKQIDEKIEISGLSLEKNQKIIDRKDRIRREYEKYATSVKMTGSEEEEMAKLLTEIESLARSSSVRIIGIKPRPIKKVQFYNIYFVELDAEGDIGQISKFIYDIQNSPQLLKVDKFSLGTKGEATNLLKCQILISKILIP